MDAKLFRDWKDDDLGWSHVGPLHERAYFNNIPLLGYAPIARSDVPPFHIYNTYEWNGPKLEVRPIQTIPAAKRAGRVWISQWLAECDGKEVEWETCDTGVHFVGRLHGMKVANYYYCTQATPQWHVGFRVWFGNTYYVTEFATPEEARLAVSETWVQWLALAKEKILKRADAVQAGASRTGSPVAIGAPAETANRKDASP